MDQDKLSWLDCADQQNRLAYQFFEGRGPAVLFCNGFQSSMSGSKVTKLKQHCQERGTPFCSFDYRGHGFSTGNVAEFTLSEWINDARQILEEPLDSFDTVILVGSSMGAAISCHLALMYPEKIGGLLGVGAAPDFFQDLYKFSTPEQRQAWQDDGVIFLPTEYSSDPYPIPWRLIQDARENWDLLENDSIPVKCPVRLIHGQCDEDVPWEKSLALAERLAIDDITLTLIKSGDHRLSREQDLSRICKLLEELLPGGF
jgi:pimeloyl-ACP methyl ester carboxylesterase